MLGGAEAAEALEDGGVGSGRVVGFVWGVGKCCWVWDFCFFKSFLWLFPWFWDGLGLWWLFGFTIFWFEARGK